MPLPPLRANRQLAQLIGGPSRAQVGQVGGEPHAQHATACVLNLAQLPSGREQIDQVAHRRRVDAEARERIGLALKVSQVSPPVASNTAVRVPGTWLTTARTAAPISSSRFGSGEMTRMPTGVLTPVAIMSMRARAGPVHALRHPGRLADRSSASISSRLVRGVASGQTSRSTRCNGPGAQLDVAAGRAFGSQMTG